MTAPEPQLSAFAGLSGGPVPRDQAALCEYLLNWLELSQGQIAALLGLTPQAISKGLKDDGISFFSKDGKAQKLYQALSLIGGDRYSLAASRLRDVAIPFNWGNLEPLSHELFPARNLYADSDEIWVVSDSPINAIDWDAMKEILFRQNPTSTPKVVVFFMRTLEGAERWAEVLEREFIRPAIQGYKVDPERGATAGAYIFIAVTNALAYSQDFVIANPGSRCMGVASSVQPLTSYFWLGRAYARASNTAREFVALAHQRQLGRGAMKEHFFPRGIPLKEDVIDFGFIFMDGLIAVRGKTSEEDESPSGEEMAGGVLRNVLSRPAQTVEFNKHTKFCPVFVLCYRRRPGDGFSRIDKKTLRVVREELERQKELDQQREQIVDSNQPTSAPSIKFW